ncbi:MAG: lysozyme [Casimicrobium sp.]
MKISDAGLDLIKEFEGLRLEAYLCPASVWTIGYGTTRGVKEGMKITREEAERFLRADVEKYEQAVNELMQQGFTSQTQFDAFVSLAYNIGRQAFATSTALKRHRNGDFAGAADAITWFNRGGGRVLPGLVRRREAEKKLYLS